MIAALFVLLFLGGTNPLLEYIEVFQDRAKTTIIDDVRRDDAKTALKSLEKRVKSYYDTQADAEKKFKRLLKNQDVAEEKLDMVWDAYRKETLAYHEDILDLHSKLKQHIQREEWQAIFADPR